MKVEKKKDRYFFIVDKANGERIQVPIKEEEGIIRQINDTFDDHLLKKEVRLNGK